MGELISLSERRASMHGRVGMPGQIEREGRQPLRCTLINISGHGACVSAPATALPNVFVLKGEGATRHVCEVLWRKDYTVGVRFVAIDQLLAGTAGATAKLKRSCARASSGRNDVAEEVG
jgi:hypothetical protein